MRKAIFSVGLGVLALAPLLAAGCGTDNTTGGLVMIPACGKAGQVLSTDSTGQFVCKDLPAGVVTIPKCDPNFDALSSDGAALFCRARNNESSQSAAAIQSLKMTESLIKDYGTQVMGLGTGGMGAKAFYQGATAPTANGAISSNGLTGVRAAADLCGAKFGTGAHMCTVYEMYESLVYAGQNPADKFDPSQNLPKQWVYMQSWKDPSGGLATDPTAGLADNCAGYTYPTGNLHWTGTAVAWEIVTGTSKNALKWFSGADAPCNVGLPIACCK